ncbi:kinase [Gloeophyllum trabeum ATCC 11539]|uniref:Kinase n=1 Tax=Gloeophyllum trabeum (strain ATCC 11539 / FP-39264 / Madison 617) TaxID=670483 RepID=S7S562_GLOTA|nr:kinase [Gloeophyllum trabeum ATCC 11539]EPQ61084.1 kinase [Gloeophyllum trabeum ATCC 11539]
MRRHTPTLFTHPELDGNEDDSPSSWGLQYSSPPLQQSGGLSSRNRIKLRTRPSYSSASSSGSNPISPPQHVPKYSDIYSQFVRRYRSGTEGDDDPRNDPDSHYLQRGLGQLVDGGESDDEELGRGGILSGDAAATLLDTEPIEPATLEERERLEWQTMLASVLAGDVLKSEKTRIAVALESSADEQSTLHADIWLGIRAKLHGRTEEEERRRLEERRLRNVDAIINEIMTFRIVDENSDTDPHTNALKHVNAILNRLDMVQSLYPNLKAFYSDKPAAAEPAFQARCDTLNTWSTVLTSIRTYVKLLRQWTGSENLDVTQPRHDKDGAVGGPSPRITKDGETEVADGTSFVERVLKEDSIQRTFEKEILTTVHSLIGTTRDAQVNLAPIFREMNLPTFENELLPLISFPTKLVQATLRLRLSYIQRLKDPEVLIIDQMIDDLKVSIGLACTLKRQYEAFLAPDPGGNWNLPSSIDRDYDNVVLEALTFFFKLIHWKLKSATKGIYFKETDLLEAQWATFNDVSLSTAGGSTLVAEQICALTNKLMVRVTNYFENQIKVPTQKENGAPSWDGLNNSTSSSHNSYIPEAHKTMTDEQMISWYSKILDSVRLRYRKLQRFARALTQRFGNSAEYSLENVSLDHVIAALVETDHFLVYTQSFEEDGTYIIAHPSLRDRPDAIRRLLMEAFHVQEITSEDGVGMSNSGDPGSDEYEEVSYILVLSPRSRFLWNGLVLMLEMPKIDLEMRDNRVRLIADGAHSRLALAKEEFAEVFMPVDEEGMPVESPIGPLSCIVEQQAHLPAVNRELRKIARATNRLAESIVDSVHHVRNVLRGVKGCQDLLENWYSFASENGQHAQRSMDRANLLKFNRLLIKLAISWVSFICDDCDPNDRKTFRWAVNALEFALHRTRRNNILQLPEDQFEMLRQKVASCMTLLISHFDILGARSSLAQKERERQEELLRQQALDATAKGEDIISRSTSPRADHEDAVASNVPPRTFRDPSVRIFWDKASRALQDLESRRAQVSSEQRVVGRVLDDRPENRSLAFLASSSSNIAIRWQQGRFIGAGAFGSVYLGVNLDSGSLMAVKEIKYQEISGQPNLFSQIKDELHVMEMLHHPNIVEYYGIEVHRDKVYIFEEYCQGGSLAALLEHGRIEDEGILQVYTMQMLEGLAYLHSQGIVHRDIKPDNILLDHLGVIKYVDFGAAKVLARNQRSIQRSRRGSTEPAPPGLANGNSLTGTPMYMSPEMIKNDRRGRHGAMDIWSLGCVVLECATGRKPWSNLDNEWAIMFQIGVATQHPPLPEPGQLSELGINFIKQCLTIDPMKRPTANELMDHPWMLEFRDALLNYEEEELATSPPSEIPSQEEYEAASVARQAAIIQEKEVEAITALSPSMSPVETPESERENPSGTPPC